MPHKGRPFPYLFPRDLYAQGFGYWGYALRYKITTTGVWNGTLAAGWNGHTLISDGGAWDYGDGSITWRFPPPAGADPSTYVQYRTHLDHIQQFGLPECEFWGPSGRLARKLAATNLWSGANFLFPVLWPSITNPALFERGDTILHLACPWAEIPP